MLKCLNQIKHFILEDVYRGWGGCMRVRGTSNMVVGVVCQFRTKPPYHTYTGNLIILSFYQPSIFPVRLFKIVAKSNLAVNINWSNFLNKNCFEISATKRTIKRVVPW